mgnify:FL=1
MDIDKEIKELKETIAKIATKLKKNNELTDELIKKISLTLHELDEIKDKKSTTGKIRTKEILKSALSCLLSVCILSSLFLIGKEITKTVVYNEDIKTYNNNLELITDKSNQKDDYLVNDKTANENIIKLRIYDKWYETENGYSRKYKEYDLSSYGDKELTYYLENIINTLSDTAKVHYQNKNMLNSEDLSNHIKYEISKINLSNYETEYKDIDALIVILILAIFELSAEIFFTYGNKNFGAISSWIYLFKNKSYIDNTEINELANLYEANVAYSKNRIKELFEENTELAKEYERLLKDENYQNMLEFINSYSSELELTKEMSKAKKRVNTLLRK